MRVACRTPKSGPYESFQNHLAVTARQICQHRNARGPERISIDAHCYLESPLSECGCTRRAIETNPHERVVADSPNCPAAAGVASAYPGPPRRHGRTCRASSGLSQLHPGFFSRRIGVYS